MTMREKVARAICFSRGGEIVGHGQSRATRELGWMPDGEHMEKYVELHWKECLHAADFALSALREPTEGMVRQLAGYVESSPWNGDRVAKDAWQAAIDAALAEGDATDASKPSAVDAHAAKAREGGA